MCLKYNADSLKAQSNDAIHHRLVKVLKFSSTKMQCAHRQSRGLYLGCNVGLKVGEKRWTNDLKFCGANSQEDYGATNNNQNENKDYQHSNPL